MRQNNREKISICIIDIGSVALRVDLYEWNPDQPESCILVKKERGLPRLGALDAQGKIQEAHLTSAISVLEETRNSLPQETYVYVLGTAVFRTAANASYASELISHTLSRPLRILSETEEASLISKAISTLEEELPPSFWLVDIGGKSTEVSLYDKGISPFMKSFNCGALSLKETFFPSLDSLSQNKEKCLNYIKEILSELPKETHFKHVIGSSGTLRCLDRMHYRSTQNKLIPVNYLKDTIDHLETASPEEYKEIVSGEEKREDLIYPGFLLLDYICNYLDIANITVSNYSVRHGALLEICENELGITPNNIKQIFQEG